jgi:hypothetical protein
VGEDSVRTLLQRRERGKGGKEIDKKINTFYHRQIKQQIGESQNNILLFFLLFFHIHERKALQRVIVDMAVASSKFADEWQVRVL